MLCEKYGDEEFNLRHCCYCDLRSLYYSCICIRRCNSVLTYTQGNMNTYMYVLGKSFFFFHTLQRSYLYVNTYHAWLKGVVRFYFIFPLLYYIIIYLIPLLKYFYSSIVDLCTYSNHKSRSKIFLDSEKKEKKKKLNKKKKRH